MKNQKIISVLIIFFTFQSCCTFFNPNLQKPNKTFPPKTTKHQKSLDSGNIDPTVKKITKNIKTRNLKNSINQRELVRLKTKTPKMLKNTQRNDVCNSAVLSYFGIVINNELKPEKSSKETLRFCSGNVETCCTENDFFDVQEYFLIGAKRYQQMMEYIEEILVSFKGTYFWMLLSRLLTKNRCLLGEEISNLKSQNIPLFYEENAYISFAEKIEELLENFKMYSRTQLYINMNIICTICDPLQNNQFDLFSKSVKLSSQTWNVMLENHIFEAKLEQIFLQFIYPIANFINCVDEDSTVGKINSRFTVKSIQAILDELKGCQENLEKESNCIEQRKLNFITFKFAYIDIDNVKVALKTIFEKMNKTKIEKYYLRVKNRNYTDDEEDDKEIPFFEPANINPKEKVMKELHVIPSDQGINPFYSYMNKKFLN